ncbi:unnamed protein product [Owenia fusiformis]|uniref:Uncharacterized protein n=1 Tax=Owenia fusiformis TaxID=6347 RepID=A0A8J1UXY5_OWEFU|nr:unnamed protein product [Owenia fusiformis]
MQIPQRWRRLMGIAIFIYLFVTLILLDVIDPLYLLKPHSNYKTKMLKNISFGTDKITSHLPHGFVMERPNVISCPPKSWNIYDAACLYTIPKHIDLDGVDMETIIYPNVSFPEPNTITSEDRRLFLTFHPNHDLLKNGPDPKSLIGRIYHIRSGTFTVKRQDCGWKSNVNETKAKNRSNVTPMNWFNILIPLVVPDGWTFQHFLDGTLPKIMQVFHFLNIPGVKILLKTPRDNIINDFLTALGITADKIVIGLDGNTYGANHLIFTCITPGIHPILWKLGRKRLGAKETLPDDVTNSSVVLLTRAFSKNGGRKLLNSDAVANTLKERYGSNFVLFQGNYNFKETLKLFGNTRAIIGVHGGAFYNINFAPSKAHIIEIMPILDNNGRIANGLAHTMVWTMSNMLDQVYWRISTRVPSGNTNVVVNIKSLIAIMDKIDETQNYSTSS